MSRALQPRHLTLDTNPCTGSRQGPSTIRRGNSAGSRWRGAERVSVGPARGERVARRSATRVSASRARRLARHGGDDARVSPTGDASAPADGGDHAIRAPRRSSRAPAARSSLRECEQASPNRRFGRSVRTTCERPGGAGSRFRHHGWKAACGDREPRASLRRDGGACAATCCAGACPRGRSGVRVDPQPARGADVLVAGRRRVCAARARGGCPLAARGPRRPGAAVASRTGGGACRDRGDRRTDALLDLERALNRSG